MNSEMGPDYREQKPLEELLEQQRDADELRRLDSNIGNLATRLLEELEKGDTPDTEQDATEQGQTIGHQIEADMNQKTPSFGSHKPNCGFSYAYSPCGDYLPHPKKCSLISGY